MVMGYAAGLESWKACMAAISMKPQKNCVTTPPKAAARYCSPMTSHIRK